MAVLDELLGKEMVFSGEALGFVAEDRPYVEELLSLVLASLESDQPLGTTAIESISRLFVDACVCLEQAFLSTLRAQPRLGWASLRFAAEALKDMDCIYRQPALEEAWFATLVKTPDEHAKALAKFRAERKKIASSEVTRMCSLTMQLANVFGAHPNASAYALLGSTAVEPGVLRLPVRATDPEILRWHVRHQLLHGYHVGVTLADFRVEHMTGRAKQSLAAQRQTFDRRMVSFVREHVPRPMAADQGPERE